MAKKKGGLGRGLNSLIGENIEETRASSVAKKENSEPKQVVEDSQAAVSTEAAKKPRIDVPKINTTPDPSLIINSEEDSKPRPYIEEDDHVEIKSIGFREVAKKEPAKSQVNLPKEELEANLEDVYPNPDQPRRIFKKEELEELASSIKREGLLQPILVRKINEGYQIIAGERRWQACKMLNLDKVPIRVKDVDEQQALEMAMVENLQRADLNPIEEAYGYKRMMMDRGMTQTEVAQAVSKGRSTIANSLRLLELPEEAQQLLHEEKITAGHARAILSVQSPDGRKKLTEKLIQEKLSVREAENIARLLNGQEKAAGSKAVKEPAPEYFKSMAKTLRKNLGTNVRIKSVKGKNKVEIEFKDEEDLKRLFQSIIS